MIRRMMVFMTMRVGVAMRRLVSLPAGVLVIERARVDPVGLHADAPATQLAQRPRSVRSWCCTSKPGGARSFIGPGQA